MPKISFVMPTKNRGLIISDSIKSIINQTEKDWELIIIDDHSKTTDKTKKVVNSFKDERIKYYRMPENWPSGIASARNFGNMMAVSSIIAPADSDDINLPNRAKLTIESFEKEKWDVFYADYDYFYQKSGEFKERVNPIQKFSLDLLKKFNFIPHPTSAYKRELAYEYPYNSFFIVAEDYDFFSRLALAEKRFYFCGEKVLHYVIHEKNISGGKKLEPVYDDLIKINRGWTKLGRQQVIKKITNYYEKKS